MSCHIAVEMCNIPDLNVQIKVILHNKSHNARQILCTLQSHITTYISYYINVGHIQMRYREFYKAAQVSAGRGQYRGIHNGGSSWSYL